MPKPSRDVLISEERDDTFDRKGYATEEYILWKDLERKALRSRAMAEAIHLEKMRDPEKTPEGSYRDPTSGFLRFNFVEPKWLDHIGTTLKLWNYLVV